MLNHTHSWHDSLQLLEPPLKVAKYGQNLGCTLSPENLHPHSPLALGPGDSIAVESHNQHAQDQI